jgi:L-histidine Nalpha-methyltransferase
MLDRAVPFTQDPRPMGAETATFLAEVQAGLAAQPKTLPCKYFYDEAGCALFDRICELDEYYLTRADLEATRDHAADMAERIGPRARLVELGSGASAKTRILLDALHEPVCYVPLDIAGPLLERVAVELRAAYPGLEVLPVHADYSQPITLPPPSGEPHRTVVYFPGSTIGNLHPPDATRFLARIRRLVGENGALVLGVDLKKDKAVLELAYDDAAGVTAAFNLNLLVRINRELGADFDLAAFAHRARYDEALGRIEMHLVSLRNQEVHVGGRGYRLVEGETIRSEESYKYSIDEIVAMAGEAGMSSEAVWTDRARLFSIHYLAAR